MENGISIKIKWFSLNKPAQETVKLKKSAKTLDKSKLRSKKVKVKKPETLRSSLKAVKKKRKT